MQSTNIDLGEAMKLLRSLNNYDPSLRDAFEDYEENRKIKIGLENELLYKGEKHPGSPHRRSMRNLMYK